MSRWEREATRRWPTAWIGGTGPFVCVVTYIKGRSVTLFRKQEDADRHKRRLDAVQPMKKRWRSADVHDMKQLQEAAAPTTTATPRLHADSPFMKDAEASAGSQ